MFLHPAMVPVKFLLHARNMLGKPLPMDGWEIVYGDDGQPKCRRTVVQELCYGTQYRDADSKERKCCQDMSGLTWIDKPA